MIESGSKRAALLSEFSWKKGLRQSDEPNKKKEKEQVGTTKLI